jgi:hypothetical protein
VSFVAVWERWFRFRYIPSTRTPASSTTGGVAFSECTACGAIKIQALTPATWRIRFAMPGPG